MTADGSSVEKLTSGAHSSSDLPRWSPDGSRIAFQIADGGRYDIGILELRDKQQTVLVGTPHNDGSYSWSPDGQRLAYISGPGGAENLYVVDVRTSRSTRITTTWSLTPSWTR
jgi:TolB protein